MVGRYTVDCPDTEQMQFILDSTVLPDMIALHFTNDWVKWCMILCFILQ